jgi:hypothetical protein
VVGLGHPLAQGRQHARRARPGPTATRLVRAVVRPDACGLPCVRVYDCGGGCFIHPLLSCVSSRCSGNRPVVHTMVGRKGSTRSNAWAVMQVLWRSWWRRTHVFEGYVASSWQSDNLRQG